MDIASAVGRELGVTERQLAELGEYATSDAFSEEERVAIDLAKAMVQERVDISAELQERLDAHFSRAQQVELASAIAWENYRARFNRVFGVRPCGFNER